MRTLIRFLYFSGVSLLAAAFVAMDFLPTFGRPFFRYTGSDPAHFVWNFGWPFTWFIYDAANPPHLFFSPVFPGLILVVIVQATIVIALFCLPFLLDWRGARSRKAAIPVTA